MAEFNYLFSAKEMKYCFDQLASTKEGSELITRVQSKGKIIFDYIKEWMTQMHQYAFSCAGEIIINNPTITEEQLKQELAKKELEYCEGKVEAVMGIENDQRMTSFAKTVFNYYKMQGLIIDSSSDNKEEESTKVEELVCPKMPEIKVREVNAKEDPILDLAKAFYKALGEYIETRTA